MIDITGGTYATRDARIAPRLTAPTPAPLQGLGVSAAGAGKAFGPAWRLRGKGATTAEFDSLPGASPV
jgi:hypothetical protein